MHSTRRIVQGSFLGSLIDFEPTHGLHVEFGYYVLIFGILHSAGWMVRIIQHGTGGFLLHNRVSCTT